MADVNNFSIPKPPENADPVALQRWARDLYNFLLANWQTGLRPPFFSQNQINQMTDLDQGGKIFFNNDTGRFMGGEVDAGALSVKTFTSS
jgi:hypothetical protein